MRTTVAFISLSLFNFLNAQQQAIRGTQCSPNQVVTKLTFYEDGAIEAECNKLPCGTSGAQCIENQASCKAETDVFSGMKWALNGQSVLLRCCSYDIPAKIYVGTDLVSLGSYYAGGLVDKKDLYGKDGIEYDFISNIRTEQGGVRVWVYRVMCQSEKISQQVQDSQPQISSGRSFAFEKRRQYLLKQMQEHESHANPSAGAQQDNFPERVTPETKRPINPLQYRPPKLQQRDEPLSDVENPTGRLL